MYIYRVTLQRMRALFFFVILMFTVLPVSAQQKPLDATERAAVINNIVDRVNERYVFPDVAAKTGEYLKAELKKGRFDSVTDPEIFADMLTQSVQSINHDKHMRVRSRPAEAMSNAGAPDPLRDRAMMTQEMREGNYGFRRVEVMEGNIGYLDLRGFNTEQFARPTAVAAMHLLENTDAVIIDLRRNGGGDPHTVQLLCSYFFDKPTHLNSLYWRDGDRTEEFWTLADLPGQRMADVPLFVLTSNYTFSGAEEFTYNMQTRKRATIVGETTGGGANPGGMVPVGERFGIFIPTGRAINPVTKTNWEGTGITPDVAVGAADALDTAITLAHAAAELRRERVVKQQQEIRAAITRGLADAQKQFAAGRKQEGMATVSEALATGKKAGLLDEEAINFIGYDFMGRDQVAVATAIFAYNAEAYPDSWNVYDSLGEAYMKNGDKQRAIELYQKSLALNPDNDNGKDMLRKLGISSK